MMLSKKKVITVEGCCGSDQYSTALSPDAYYIVCSGFNYRSGV